MEQPYTKPYKTKIINWDNINIDELKHFLKKHIKKGDV